MRNVLTRNVFAGLVILASVGFSHAAELSASICEGFPLQYTVVKDDWLSTIGESAYFNIPHAMSDAVQLLMDENPSIKDRDLILVGQVITIPCPAPIMVSRRRFIAPERSAVPMEVATISAPEISIRREFSLPIFAMDFPALAPPETAEQVADDIVVPNTPVSKPLPPVTSKKQVKVKGEIYHVFLQLPKGVVAGVSHGEFPAELLSNQKTDGTWRHRERISAKIKSEDIADHDEIEIKLKKSPAKDSVFLFELVNGKQFPVGSSVLSKGAMISGSLPKPLDKNAYASLEAGMPKEHNRVGRLAMTILPTAGQAGLGFALGVGPFGLIPVATSSVSRFFGGRMSASKRNAPPAINGAQQNEIDALRAQNAEISGRLQAIEALLNQSTSETKVAMEMRK